MFHSSLSFVIFVTFR